MLSSEEDKMLKRVVVNSLFTFNFPSWHCLFFFSRKIVKNNQTVHQSVSLYGVRKKLGQEKLHMTMKDYSLLGLNRGK